MLAGAHLRAGSKPTPKRVERLSASCAAGRETVARARPPLAGLRTGLDDSSSSPALALTLGQPARDARSCVRRDRWAARNHAGREETSGTRLGSWADENGVADSCSCDGQCCVQRESLCAGELRPKGLVHGDGMFSHVALPVASPGPLAGVIGVVGFLAVVAWVAWRFGPTLTRLTGWCSWWVAWACGSQGGYGYCIAFLLLGALAWGAGTIWYARRCGHWPTALSARLFARLLGRHNSITRAEFPAIVIAPRRRR
jgi:hypothetical protein